MYEVKIFDTLSISQLKTDWELLQSGEDMTYFQSFDWYLMLSQINQKKYNKHAVVFIEVLYNGMPCLIAPLWIVFKTFGLVNRKGVYFFGRQGWNDYCNIIYKQFDENAVDFLFGYIEKKLKINEFRFDLLRENSSFYEYLKSNYDLMLDRKETCVRLELSESEEAYLKKLSKNSKQNIRTARNRAVTDGVTYIIKFDDKNVDLQSFAKFRQMRVEKKQSFQPSFQWLKNWIYQHMVYKFPEYTPFKEDENCHFLTMTNDKNNELCAAFCYGLDSAHREVVVMAVSLNERYSRYSPGMLALYSYIVDCTTAKNVSVIDFNRGTERYKYVLGGNEHYIHSVKLKISR